MQITASYKHHLFATVIINVGQSIDQSHRPCIRVNTVDQSRSSMHPGDDCRTTLFDIGNAASYHITCYPTVLLKNTKKRHRKLMNFSFRVTGPCNQLGGYWDYPSEHSVFKFKWPMVIEPKCSTKTFTVMCQLIFLEVKAEGAPGR
jgi:hypothetical protein